MSYILDALRRSQAERERGRIPGLDARPGAGAALPPRRSRLPWRWLLPALLGLAAMLALWVWRAQTDEVPAPQPTANSAPTIQAAATPPGQGATALPPPALAAPSAAAASELPVVVSAPPTPAPPPTSPAPALPAPAVGKAAASAPAAIALAALSAEQRRELPALVLGGSIWSDNAANRFVIVNGQVVREGDTAAPGVVVERIGPKSVLLRWRALRVEVPL